LTSRERLAGRRAAGSTAVGWERSLKKLGTLRTALILGGVGILVLVVIIACCYAVYKYRKIRRRALEASRARSYLSPEPNGRSPVDRTATPPARRSNQRVPVDRPFTPPTRSGNRRSWWSRWWSGDSGGCVAMLMHICARHSLTHCLCVAPPFVHVPRCRAAPPWGGGRFAKVAQRTDTRLRASRGTTSVWEPGRSPIVAGLSASYRPGVAPGAEEMPTFHATKPMPPHTAYSAGSTLAGSLRASFDAAAGGSDPSLSHPSRYASLLPLAFCTDHHESVRLT
jgi:hypothetical protein